MENLAEELDEHALIEEALANFAVLLDDLDFAQELNILGIGRFQFMRRKLMQLELRSLSIALWRLALARSFPNVADLMFEMFLLRYKHNHGGKATEQTIERAREYWSMIQPVGDRDFSNIARHLVSFIEREPENQRPLVLKITLNIRKHYSFIFERLI